MRKIFTFLCAALMSAGMWALTPQGSDAWDDATKTLTVNSNPDDYAYYGESDIENLVISDAVTSIGESAFANCSGLTSIEVASGNTTYDSRDNCNAIIETSSNTLIQGCQNTIIPNSVTSIGDEAFSGCTGLTSVTIGNSVTSIGQSAFAGCEGLTSITIPNSVTSIGGSAFIGCSGLTSVTIGNSVTSIGDYAFYRCSALTSVTINAESLESYGSGAFDDTHADLTIYVPAGSVDTYKAAENWADYAAKIVAIPGGGSTPEPEPAEVTVVFAANDKTVEKTVTLPHTFKCDWGNGIDDPDELDRIIVELYNDYYYCNNNINASGSDQVEAGTDEQSNDYITIKGVFEGSATVTGDYATLESDAGLHYTLTISIKGDEPEPDSETLATNKELSVYTGTHFSVTPNPGQEGDSNGFWVSYPEDRAVISTLNGETILSVELTVGYGEEYIPYFGASKGNVSHSGSLITISEVNATSVELLMTYISALQISQVKIYYEEKSEPTAIDQITNDKSQMTNKVIRNGILLIERDGKTYNATGAQVR